MKACVLLATAPITSNPLEFEDVPKPEPGPGGVLIRVSVCGVCRTDLHVIEGELPPRKSPVIPGHQIVGFVEKMGEVKRGGSADWPAARVQAFSIWLNRTDQTCEYCRGGAENLCDHPEFTGYTVDGGYAEYAVAPEAFAYPLPEAFHDQQAAPLLCAGIIGFRCLSFPAFRKVRGAGSDWHSMDLERQRT